MSDRSPFKPVSLKQTRQSTWLMLSQYFLVCGGVGALIAGILAQVVTKHPLWSLAPAIVLLMVSVGVSMYFNRCFFTGREAYIWVARDTEGKVWIESQRPACNSLGRHFISVPDEHGSDEQRFIVGYMFRIARDPLFSGSSEVVAAEPGLAINPRWEITGCDEPNIHLRDTDGSFISLPAAAALELVYRFNSIATAISSSGELTVFIENAIIQLKEGRNHLKSPVGRELRQSLERGLREHLTDPNRYPVHISITAPKEIVKAAATAA